MFSDVLHQDYLGRKDKSQNFNRGAELDLKIVLYVFIFFTNRQKFSKVTFPIHSYYVFIQNIKKSL